MKLKRKTQSEIAVEVLAKLIYTLDLELLYCAKITGISYKYFRLQFNEEAMDVDLELPYILAKALYERHQTIIDNYAGFNIKKTFLRTCNYVGISRASIQTILPMSVRDYRHICNPTSEKRIKKNWTKKYNYYRRNLKLLIKDRMKYIKSVVKNS